MGSGTVPPEFRTVDEMIELGASLPPLEELRWEKGQGGKQTAFLCYSSGTSGLPVSIIRFEVITALNMAFPDAERGNDHAS